MAHARRSFRGRGISDSQCRKKSWIQVTAPSGSTAAPTDNNAEQTPNIQFFLPAATPTLSTFGSSVGFISDPVLDKVPAESTILRIRGSINMPKNFQDAGENVNYAVGIGVMEATAAALGAFPNPSTPDGGAWDGWMFYRSQQAGSLDANATIFDVKSMRKVQSGQAIVIVFGQFKTKFDGTVPGPTLDTSTQMNLRALILLP